MGESMAEKTVPHTEQSLTQVALNLGLHPDAAINQGPPEGKGKGVTIGRSRILLPPASVTTLCGTSLRPSEGSVGAMLTSEVLCRRGAAFVSVRTIKRHHHHQGSQVKCFALKCCAGEEPRRERGRICREEEFVERKNL